MGSKRAAPEEVRTEAKVRLPTVPEVNVGESSAQNNWLAEQEVNGWVSEEHKKWLLAEGGLREEEEVEEVDKIEDFLGEEASKFKDIWNRMYSHYRGRFEDTTNIPNKRFTYPKLHDNNPRISGLQTTLQVFALKIAKVRKGLQWPLQVFGMVAIRDCMDQNRNIIFNRPRDHCQIVTREDPYLKLTGPTRVVVVWDPATFEVDLKVKGTTESEDQWLSFLAMTYCHFSKLNSHRFEREYESKLCELQFHLGSITYSVEATIEVRMTSGSWPRGLGVQFAAGTISIPGAEIILLDSGDNEKPLAGDGIIKLSRSVASVEVGGKLMVCVKAFLGDKIVANKAVFFKPKTAGVSNDSLSVDFDRDISMSKTKTAGKGDAPVGLNHGLGFLGCCKFEFNIFWSLISSYR